MEPPRALAPAPGARSQASPAGAERAPAGGRPTERRPVLRRRSGGTERASDLLAVEEPLEIRVNGNPIAVTMRTPAPGQDTELALGFLHGEGIACPDDVVRIQECRAPEGDGGLVEVQLRGDLEPDGGWQREFYASSSCGICGKATIEAVRQGTEPLADGPEVSADVLDRLPEALRGGQRVFDRTGGLHAAAIFTSSGELLILREDVGRHNAVDKAIGRALMRDLVPLRDHVLLVSGRVSFEIAQKALLAGIPVLAAVSAPSSLAVRLAAESNMTLVGFLRPDGLNVYAGAERLALANGD